MSTCFFGTGSGLEEIIQDFGGSYHLSTISLNDFYLFKIVKSVISFCLKKKNLTQ